MELTWLRDRLDLGDKYPNIRDFKRWVLQPAIVHINAHSDIWVKWEQRKRGRVVHVLTFTFSPKAEQKTLPQSKSAKPKLTRAYIEQNGYPSESRGDAIDVGADGCHPRRCGLIA